MRALLPLALLLAVAAPALAQQDAARAHYQSGAAYYARGQYDEAIREFEQSYQLSKKPEILYNLAQCNDKLGRRPRVIEFLRRYLDEKPKADDREQVTAWLRNLEEAEARERDAAARAASERSTLERTAAEARAAAEAQRRPDVTKPPPVTADPARHKSQRRLQVALTSVAAGVAVAGFALGAGFGVVARNKNDDSRSRCHDGNLCDAAGVSLRHDAMNAGNVATAGFVVGGVAAASAIVLFFTLRPRKAEVQPRTAWLEASPALGPTSAGLTLRGGW
jgi:tetratricopeptide (TPR) repeat protein